MKPKKSEQSWFIGTMGIIFTVSSMIFLIAFFHYVSVGEWIAKESYYDEEGDLDKGEWFKQAGLFIAFMSGINWFVCSSLEEAEKFPPFVKGKEKNET